MGLLSNLRMTLDSLAKSVLAPAEDPRENAGGAYQRQLDLMEQIRLALVQVAQARRRLQSSAARLRSRLSGYQEQARTALAAGQDDLARQVLHRRHLAAAEVDALQGRIARLIQEEARLAQAEQQLAVRLDAFQTEREIDQARSDARARIGDVLEQVSNDLARLGLTLAQTRRGAGLEDIDESFDLLDGILEATGPDASEGSLRRMEAEEQVEAELAALRMDLNQRAADRRRVEPEAQAGA